MLRALAAVAIAAAFVPSATASEQTGFAFGRVGGNIGPFTVVIATDGSVRKTGPVATRTTPVPRLQLGKLNQLAVTIGFAKLPKATNCQGTHPDVAATFIRVGRRTVRVHGECVAPYLRLYNALQKAAGVRY
jgi:hypothetical protein